MQMRSLRGLAHLVLPVLLVSVAIIGCSGVDAHRETKDGLSDEIDTDAAAKPDVVLDLSLLIASDLPATWPTFPPFQLTHRHPIGRASPYNVDILTIDANTGTQLDTPPHSIPRPGSGLPHEGPAGTLFTESIPAWQFCGEACVVDIRELVGQAETGQSPFVLAEHVKAWEIEHRPLGEGDVLLFRSDWSDRTYVPLPEGRGYIAACVDGEVVAYPNPHPSCLEYVAERGVMHVGTDSPSMGPLPDLANDTHVAGLAHGGIFTEGATGLGALPETGAFYAMLSPKHVGGAYAEGRAIAIVDPAVAPRLIASAKAKRVLDLSVEMSPEHPVSFPGVRTGEHRQPYFQIDFLYAAGIDYWHNTHVMDAHSGTHLVPPAWAVPGPGEEVEYAPEVAAWLEEFETRYRFRPRTRARATAESVPVSMTCGRARRIDVRPLVGLSAAASWPHSPEITPEFVKAYEAATGPLEPGDIVIFASGHTDAYYAPLPDGEACFARPLRGLSEGWPAPTPETIVHLMERGIRCVATDAPMLGSVDPKEALWIYWMLGSFGMVAVEYLAHAVDIPDDAWFIFAGLKIRGAHGAPGRALCLY